MNNISRATIVELVDIFEKISYILKNENEHNWIRGINSILDKLRQSAASDLELETVFRDVGVSYRYMNAGQGSFADFMIFRNDLTERQQLNQKFQSLADKAWKLLDLYCPVLTVRMVWVNVFVAYLSKLATVSLRFNFIPPFKVAKYFTFALTFI
jgi:hypothetical protein